MWVPLFIRGFFIINAEPDSFAWRFAEQHGPSTCAVAFRVQDAAGAYRRVPGHGEDLRALRQRRILIDGAPTQGQGLLLQIFTANVIGPIFFEIIQRKGNEGFGEGNFQALFESIEQDQVRRGVL